MNDEKEVIERVQTCEHCGAWYLDKNIEFKGVVVPKEDLKELNYKPLYTTEQIKEMPKTLKPQIFWINWNYIKKFLERYLEG